MSTLRDYVTSAARDGHIAAADIRAVADCFGFGLRETEEVALELGIMPERYLRNTGSISMEEQLKLLRSTVAVIGCGGLGGCLIEILARLGVGRLIVFDPDSFEEHNFNRQLLCDTVSIGTPKSDAAVRRAAAVNPAVEVAAYRAAFTRSFGRAEIAGAHAVADALDDIQARLELAVACRGLGVPLVHGAIAGWYGQVAVQFPGEKILETVYPASGQAKGVEVRTGNPAFTPWAVASLQAAEISKILLGRPTALRGKLLCIDLENMDFQAVDIR
ncbi:MAG: HesA/MoeB/ThiF family protein [Spirochaetes bacterium]|nr:MAG: HesA/MoeB/ThiF family protein [Spirochaetota bacterium]